jgi:hypothetical protein
MKNIKGMIKKYSFKRVWSHVHDGQKIEVTNWWSILGMSGECFYLNGRLLHENFFWFISLNSEFVFKLNPKEECRVILATKGWGSVGCHIYINGNLVAGDVKEELAN